jgi:hypothetical protein
MGATAIRTLRASSRVSAVPTPAPRSTSHDAGEASTATQCGTIPGMRFESAVVLNGKSATGIPVPAEVVEDLGGGKRIKVVATIGDYSYRNSVVSWGDGFMLSFGADHRAATGLEAGDRVTLVRDEAERTVELADDFATALASDSSAQAFFDGLSYSQKRWFTLGLAAAKKPETRARRIEKYVAMLAESRAR